MKKTGDDYFDSDEFREMVAEYEEAVSTGQPVFMDAEELTEIADYYHCTGRQERADDAIQLAISLSPDAIAPLDYLFHEALYADDTKQAAEMLDRMLDKSEPEYIYDRAELMLHNGDVREADKYLREELQHVDDDERQDFIVDIASLLSDYDQHELAMEWLNQGKAEDTLDYKELRANLLGGVGKYNDSKKIFNELIDHNPFQTRYWNELTSVHMLEEDYAKAVESSEYALAIDPTDTKALFDKANGLYNLNNFDEAIEYYDRYIEQVPDDTFALLCKGMCLLNLNRTDDAIKVLEQAEELDDERYYADIAQELAFAYNDNGETERALELLDSIDSDDPDQRSDLMIMKGHLLLSTNRANEAERTFYEAINMSSDPMSASVRVITIIIENHDYNSAYRLFKILFGVAPDSFNEGYAYMALCCYEMKRHDEFLKYLKEACQRNPQECRNALGHLFPTDVKPQDYYNYIAGKMKS